jgi:hypothetical protein
MTADAAFAGARHSRRGVRLRVRDRSRSGLGGRDRRCVGGRRLRHVPVRVRAHPARRAGLARCAARLRPPVCAAWTAQTGAATRSASRGGGWTRGFRLVLAGACSCPRALRMPTVRWNAGTSPSRSTTRSLKSRNSITTSRASRRAAAAPRTRAPNSPAPRKGRMSDVALAHDRLRCPLTRSSVFRTASLPTRS